MTLLIKNIKGLVQCFEEPVLRRSGDEMSYLPVLDDAFVRCTNGRISDYGPMSSYDPSENEEVLDASGRYVFPSYVDSHSHIVFAGSRESEFVDKIKGLSYAEIAAKGGGILNSAKKLQSTSEDQLFEESLPRVFDVISMGTGALEIKSGYGLTLSDEIKMLKVAKRLGKETDLTVKTTFLGAHAIPKEYKNRRTYIDLVIKEMIPQVASEKLADYCDVFCEEGFFTPSETEEVLEAGLDYGLKPKVHANQLNISGGVEVGVDCGAISVDHLESMGDEQIKKLMGSDTIGTALPGAAYFLRLPFPPARKMIDAGLSLAIATDFNPGSAPSGNMSQMVSMACIRMRMTPEEAFNAATINGAYALELSATHGSITKGKVANLFITKPIPSIDFIPYSFGSQLVDKVVLNGEIVKP